MARTVVGLFDNQSLANQVAGELKETRVPYCEIRVLVNPLDLAVNNQMSTPHTDFIAALSRDLREIGATDEEANVYVNSVENGGALVLATGTAEQVDAVASVMNKHHAAEVEKLAGLEPALPATHLGSGAVRQESTLTGRFRQSGGGARIFVW